MPVVAVLVGLRASGKTTFCRDVLGAEYVHISKDDFPNAKNRQRRQLRLISEALGAGRHVAVDNTNPSPAEWQPLIDAARRHGAQVVGYWFPPDLEGSMGRNAVRQGQSRVPDAGIHATMARLRQPARADGFDAVLAVRIVADGGFEMLPTDQEIARGR